MKKIILSIALLFALPLMVNAEESVSTPKKAASEEHHMQNANPNATEAPATEVAPEHTMQNSTPNPKDKPKAPEHVMRNN